MVRRGLFILRWMHGKTAMAAAAAHRFANPIAPFGALRAGAPSLLRLRRP